MLRPLVKQIRKIPHLGARDFVLEHFPADSVGAEIGVLRGEFSARILAMVEPRRLHLIDPWLHHEGAEYDQALYGGGADGQQAMDALYRGVRERFDAEIESGRVVIHRATSDQAAAEIEDGSLDFVYIDGNHLYEYVMRDLELYLPKLKPSGFLAGDDYGAAGWWQDGVTRAVDEFRAGDACTTVVRRGKQFVLRKNP